MTERELEMTDEERREWPERMSEAEYQERRARMFARFHEEMVPIDYSEPEPKWWQFLICGVALLALLICGVALLALLPAIFTPQWLWAIYQVVALCCVIACLVNFIGRVEAGWKKSVEDPLKARQRRNGNRDTRS